MESKKKNVKVTNRTLLIALLFFAILLIRIAYLAISPKIDNVDLQKFASKRTIAKKTIKSSRGTIFDSKGNVLAQDVSSYTLIAYLDPKRTTDPKKPEHVVDKENTAVILSAILDIDENTILKYLNKEGVYQTEFGSKAKGLNEITKDKILKAKLPGISFIETTKRYYPYGDFASYLVGYAKENSESKLIGELGVEKNYNEDLTGVDGFTMYQKDLKGYKIAGTKEQTINEKNGNDIYLTIDNNVQFFVEQAIDKYSNYAYEDLSIVIANAKSGKILAYANNPSFNPNIRNLKNYMDEISSVAFEPGSTMKIFTYMAALESGVYNGSEKYKSGQFVTKDKTVISDWNDVGWGNISYDQGFVYSSNTAVVNLMDKYLDPSFFKNYLLKLGFGSKTGIGGTLESKGKIDFKYETEILNASFGQGITTTPIQYIKALTAVANNGVLIEPYIVDKIVDSNGKTIFASKRKELGTVASVETIEYLKKLMYRTINEDDAAGVNYRIKGFDLIGKTGTAQIASTNGKGYLTGAYNLNRSVALLFPKENPEIIIYGVVKKGGSTQALSNVVKEIVTNISKYYNIYDDNEDAKNEVCKIDNYINKDVKVVKENLNKYNINPIILGSGNKIIDYYPKSGNVTSDDKVFLVTNSEIKMPNIIGYSKNDLITLLNILKIEYTISGNGYVISQSIKEGTILNKESILDVKLNLMY